MASSSVVSAEQTAHSRALWQRPGLWLMVLLIGYVFWNVVRASRDPAAFAEYYGLPAVASGQEAFVYVYALRTLFIGLFALALLLRRNYGSLALFTLLGTLLPLGDALLVAQYGSGLNVVLRHLLVAVFLLVTAFFVQRMAKR
jgi:hypothetical protein